MNLNDTFPKEPGAYLIQDDITGKAYIGATGNLAHRLSMHRYALKTNTHYNLGLQELYNQNNNLSVAALSLPDKESAFDFEQAVLDDFYDSGLLTNKSKLARQSYREIVFTDEVREKIRQSKLGKQFRLGVSHTDETKAKMSASQLKRHETYIVSEETKQKRKESMKDYVVSNETREKLRISSTGRFYSDETRRKISDSRMGIVFTDEHKNKLSQKKINPVVINDVQYRNFTVASKELGVAKRIVQHRCHSPNYPNWKKV